jgi:hypothetical protein
MTLVENPRRAYDPFAPHMVEASEAIVESGSVEDPDKLKNKAEVIDAITPGPETAPKKPAPKKTAGNTPARKPRTTKTEE